MILARFLKRLCRGLRAEAYLHGVLGSVFALHGYLTYKKTHPPRILP